VKTAFLILAHEHPALLARLVHRLEHPESAIFVHVDRKRDCQPFKSAVGDGALFLEDEARIESHWGAYSVIRATLNLVRTACEIAPMTERFVLLSGVDYPVLSTEEIIKFLSKDVEVIQVDRALDPCGRSEFDRCANRIFLGERGFMNPRTGHAWLNWCRALVARVPRVPAYGATIFYGPPHWALTREAVQIILKIEQAAPEKIQWFRYALYPDEMVFHTLLKHSARADKIVYDATKVTPHWHPRLAGIGYIDWDNPNPSTPRILELGDLAQIRASGAMFARKMHPGRSAALMDALDAGVVPRT